MTYRARVLHAFAAHSPECLAARFVTARKELGNQQERDDLPFGSGFLLI